MGRFTTSYQRCLRLNVGLSYCRSISKVRLQPNPFLNELTSMFGRTTEHGSVWVTLKHSSDKSKAQLNKMKKAGENIEFKCLIRATDGKKNISTMVCGGAVVLTDCIYWLLIYPLFTPNVYKLRFLVVGMHSVNAATLLGDVIMNSLRFPFFRFAYFVLYTCTFVAFQWLVHMCVSKWWSYPFLDISFKYAPLLYLMVGVIHLPCYGLFALVIAMKYWLARLFKWLSKKLSGETK